MKTTLKVRHVSIAIERAPDEVYRFVADVQNWARWAAGLGSIKGKDGDAWIATGPLGEVKVRIAAQNPFRVLDHEVTVPSGTTFQDPLRVLPNGQGSEVVFSVFRHAGVSDRDYERDTTAVKADLETLKKLLEGGAA